MEILLLSFLPFVHTSCSAAPLSPPKSVPWSADPDARYGDRIDVIWFQYSRELGRSACLYE
jgi:hypothetical protein